VVYRPQRIDFIDEKTTDAIVGALRQELAAASRGNDIPRALHHGTGDEERVISRHGKGSS
jgi:hypothetical protein